MHFSLIFVPNMSQQEVGFLDGEKVVLQDFGGV